MTDKRQWYAMYLLYIKPAKAAPALEEAGLEHFAPPGVSNFIFIRAEKPALDEFIHHTMVGLRVRFMRSRIDGSEIIVRDEDMDIFIRICQSRELPVIMTEAPKVKLGDRVRVKEGPLTGTTGNVVRIRKQKRVLVCVAGIIWAATAHIPEEMLEVLPPEEATDGNHSGGIHAGATDGNQTGGIHADGHTTNHTGGHDTQHSNHTTHTNQNKESK